MPTCRQMISCSKGNWIDLPVAILTSRFISPWLVHQNLGYFFPWAWHYPCKIRCSIQLISHQLTGGVVLVLYRRTWFWKVCQAQGRIRWSLWVVHDISAQSFFWICVFFTKLHLISFIPVSLVMMIASIIFISWCH